MFLSTTQSGLVTAIVFTITIIIIVKDCSPNPGTEFLLVFPDSRNDTKTADSISGEILITLDTTSYSGHDILDTRVKVNMNDPEEEIKLNVNRTTPGVVLVTGSDRTFPAGYFKGQKYMMHLVATNNVTVVVRTGAKSNFDTYLAIPIPQLGKTYLAYAYTSTLSQSASFVVIATEKHAAYVKITLPSESYERLGIQITIENITYQNGDVIMFLNLDPFEACQLQFHKSDITGVLIESDNAVAVWSGNNRTGENDRFKTGNSNTKSHVIEQIPPTAMAGTQFVACASCNQNPNSVYRVMSIYTNTHVTVFSSTSGEQQQQQSEMMTSYSLRLARAVIELTSHGVVRMEKVSSIETSKPSIVYFVSFSNLDGVGDLSSMLIPPLDAGLPSGYTFYIPDLRNANHTITFVFETPGEITLNGLSLSLAGNLYGLHLDDNLGTYFPDIAGKPGYTVGCLCGKSPKKGSYELRHTLGTPFLALYEETRGNDGQGHPLTYGLNFPAWVADQNDNAECCVSVDAEGVSLFNGECTEDNAVTCCLLEHQIKACQAKATTKTCHLLTKPRLSSHQQVLVAETPLACQAICIDTAGCLGVNIDGTVSNPASTPSCQLLFGSTLGYDENAPRTWNYLSCSTTVKYTLH